MTEYRQKRRFQSTPEPPTETVDEDVDPFSAPVGDTFVIQQHYATRLHHDLRLEMRNGDTPVLVSWAIPKGLPRNKGERALAIHTEDHPMGYAIFSGTIPEGNYGAGEVRIFDRGRYDLVERSRERITVRLDGERLCGTYHLVRTGQEGGKDQWLAILSHDERPAGEKPPDRSPMLATLVDESFDDAGWAFEPKWDGVRAIAMCTETTALISRNCRDITSAYPELSQLHDRLVALDAMLDGEVVAFDDGQPSFQRLQERMHVRDPRKVERLVQRIPVVFMVFDILYLDGIDLTTLPLSQRRERLEEVVVPSDQVHVSPLVEGRGMAMFAAAAEEGLEGIMAKKLASRYEPGRRSRMWLKVKVVLQADVVVVGWTEGEGRRQGTLGSLVMAVYDGDEMRYVGNVGTGFDDASLADALQRLRTLEQTGPPLRPQVLRSHPDLRRAHWVRPQLVAKVEYRQVTDAGMLRAPSFQGFREDKAPEECTFDQLLASG